MYVANLEGARKFFTEFFGATSNELYHNPRTGLRTYFLTFPDGGRLEIMNRPEVDVADNPVCRSGFIHLSFCLGSREEVDRMTSILSSHGYEVLLGPRVTGDGYYESCIKGFEGNLIELTDYKIIMNKEYIIFQENGLFGLKDNTGKIIISPQYMEMYDFSCGLSLVRNEQYQYAYIDITNKQVVPFAKYAWCDPQFICGFARVMSFDKIWAIKEEYVFSLKAFIGEKEEHLNLREMQKRNILDGLKYICVYSVEEFKQLTNCEKLFVKSSPNDYHLFFTYGTNIGCVAVSAIPQEPVIAIVCNSSGKIFPLLIEKKDIGKTSLPTFKPSQQKKNCPKTHYRKTSFWDYEDEKMNDVDNWSDPYGDEQAYYDGWSKDDVESGLSDAYEGDLDARWNND